MSKTGLLLKGEEVSLRSVIQSDVKIIHELNKNPNVSKYNTLPIPASYQVSNDLVKQLVDENTKALVKKYTCAITLNKTDELIGLLGLFLGDEKYEVAEIWYKLFPAYWGKGYATAAAKLMLDFAFNELKLHRVEAGCAIENEASIKVLEKIGMVKEGHKRKNLPLRSGWADNYEFAILEEDYFKMNLPG